MASVAWEIWLATYITGSGDVDLASAIAASGGQTFSGTGGVALGSTLAGTGAETFSGSGATALSSALAGSGAETFSGTGTQAETYSLAGIGTEAFSGTGALAQTYALAGSETETFTGTGDVALGLTVVGTGDNGVVQIFAGGFTPRPFIPFVAPPPPLPAITLVSIVGRGGITTVKPAIAGSGDVNDDELVLLLAA